MDILYWGSYQALSHGVIITWHAIAITVERLEPIIPKSAKTLTLIFASSVDAWDSLIIYWGRIDYNIISENNDELRSTKRSWYFGGVRRLRSKWEIDTV